MGEVRKETRLLEVGCGTANYLLALAQITGCPAWGINPSRGMLAKARERMQAENSPEAIILPGRAEALDFPNRSFDLVFLVDVIHHVQDRAAYFQEAWRVLAPGGRLCTVTDSEDIIRRRCPLSAYFPETVEPELKRYPPIPELHRLMMLAGFTGLQEVTVEFPYALADPQAFRDRAFSSLHLISVQAFQRGLERMERDLEKGPIACVLTVLSAAVGGESRAVHFHSPVRLLFAGRGSGQGWGPFGRLMLPPMGKGDETFRYV